MASVDPIIDPVVDPVPRPNGVLPASKVAVLLDPQVINCPTHLRIPEHIRLHLKREATRLGIDVFDHTQNLLYKGVHADVMEQQKLSSDEAHDYLNKHIDELNQIQQMLADFQ